MFQRKVNNVYPEGPEAKDDDDEVDGVSQEHEDVDVCDGAVLRLYQSSEELTDRTADRHTSRRQRERHRCVNKHNEPSLYR